MHGGGSPVGAWPCRRAEGRRGGAMARVSRAAWLYIAVVAAAAVTVIMARHTMAHPMGWWIQLGVLQLLFLVCEATPTPLAPRQSAWSPSSSATLAAVVLLGPMGAALTGAVAVISLRRHLMVAERLFNGAMYAVYGFAVRQAVVYA